MNTFVGKTGSSKIVELNVGDSNVVGYAAYEHGRLARALFVNLHAWLASSEGERPSVHVDFDFAEDEVAKREEEAEEKGWKVTAKRLVIEHADDVEGLIWVGQSWENSEIRPRGRLVAERIVLSEGVDLRSTEAILVEF